MLPIPQLNFGFSDAENYQRRENKELFNLIFVRNAFLEKLLSPSTYFLIGEKGTGKTAYAVFLANNYYDETVSELKYLRETDYQKFVTLKREKHLQLSDYASIWKVIILLLLTKNVRSEELDYNPFSKSLKIKALMQGIDEYYANAFSPEIIHALSWIENSKLAAELVAKYLKLGGEKGSTISFQESRFQVHLLYIQNQFEKAIKDLKLKSNHVLFIDGIDIRPGSIPYQEYLECVKGLADAVWSVNNDVLSQIKGSKGRFRAVLLLRPDIYNSIGLQNATSKIRDNSVYLDWRTTYPNYRNSDIFYLADKLLAAQQDTKMELGNAWDYYFPWESRATSNSREFDPSFLGFLRLSYSRPRDMVTMMQIMQEEFKGKRKSKGKTFTEEHFKSYEFQNKYSEYLMGGIKDQLSFYYNSADYEMFLRFFSFLDGKAEFNYDQYLAAYTAFIEYIRKNRDDKPEFLDTPDNFLQFLYDTNIICYIDGTDLEPLFYFCYRERSPSTISPKVKSGKRYRIHYGLFKALNVGFQKMK